MSQLFIYDDAAARQFEPFALTRPAGELRAGAELIRRRWEMTTGLEATGFISSPHLSDFNENGAPPAVASAAVIPAGSMLVNSRFVPALDARLSGSAGAADGSVCLVRVSSDLPATELSDGIVTLDSLAAGKSAAPLDGRWLKAPWELVGTLIDQLNEDIPVIAETLGLKKFSGQSIGNNAVFVESGASIDPFVAFDTTAGPVLIRSGASVASFTRLVGPVYIGEHATVMSDSISGCSIGDWCKVRGEISNTVMLGYSNKGHTGFVGHSYLGRWVNLGSGTTTSNLKNTYGTVQMWTPLGIVDTGTQFLGTLFGDHAKTGIGMMLTTGSVVGAGANIFGTIMPPKAVAPFSWGDSEPYSTFEEEKFLLVAERVMARRHVELDKKARRHLKTCFARRWHS